MAEALEALAVLVGKPEQLTDHEKRNGGREVLDQVRDRACGLELIELALDDRSDPWLESLETAHRELRSENLAELRVLRWVSETEASDVAVRRCLVASDQWTDVVAEVRGVGQHGAGRLMS